MTAWSGLFDNIHGSPHALLAQRSSIKRRINKLFRRRGAAVFKELLLTVNGVVVGSTAEASYSRAEAVQGLGDFVLGGSRTIETVSQVNRATVTADTTENAAVLNEQGDTNAYQTDASGNGGGGKLGSI